MFMICEQNEIEMWIRFHHCDANSYFGWAIYIYILPMIWRNNQLTILTLSSFSNSSLIFLDVYFPSCIFHINRVHVWGINSIHLIMPSRKNIINSGSLKEQYSDIEYENHFSYVRICEKCTSLILYMEVKCYWY